MSWLSNLTGIDINVGKIVDGITGKSQADASRDAAAIQADAATNAAQLAADATAQQRADLQPFTNFGSSFIDPAQQAVADQQNLYGANAGEDLMNSSMFKAITDQNQTNIMQNSALRGRLDTGGTQTALQNSALTTGYDILNQERNAALANSSFLSNLVGQGQNAAASQGAAGITGAQIEGNSLTDAGAATAGGIMGAANAYSDGANNILGLGTAALSGGLKLPSFGNIGDTISKFGMPSIGTALNPTKVATLPGQSYGR